MIHVAEQLGRRFKFVRVDIFYTGDRIYVGELTFWPAAGHYESEDQKKLGQLLDFDRTTYRPFLLPELEAKCSRFSLYPLSHAAKKLNLERNKGYN